MSFLTRLTSSARIILLPTVQQQKKKKAEIIGIYLVVHERNGYDVGLKLQSRFCRQTPVRMVKVNSVDSLEGTTRYGQSELSRLFQKTLLGWSK